MKFFLVLLSCFLFLSSPVFAQEAPADKGLSEAEISDLLGTLEDPAKRDEFIQNLKNLTEAQKEINPPEALPVLSETLKLNEGTSALMVRYEAFLDSTGLQGSTLGKIGLTVLVIVIAALLFFAIGKFGIFLRERAIAIKKKLGLQHSRLRFYSRLVRFALFVVTGILFLYTLNIIWDVADMTFLQGDLFSAFIGQIISVFLVVLIAILVWEGINAIMDNIVYRASYRDSARLQTVMPIVRNVTFIVFMVMFSLILLSEIGINIVPLLAGAGVVGVAIGFGAQSIVKDFLTGFTIILEDLIQVGDVVTLGGKTGTIEKITIRKVQLRDLQGIVYTIPFSDVGIIENATKLFSFYAMDIGVAYREDTDAVIRLLREVDDDLRQDEKYKDNILEPIDILGVDAFADSAVIIKARIKTKPSKQWEVGREFNRRMKYKFDQNGVEIPFPHQTVYFGVDKEGKAPPVNITLSGDKKII